MTEHPISVMSEVTYIVPNLREDCCGEKEIRNKTIMLSPRRNDPKHVCPDFSWSPKVKIYR
jgi:hypothetical protein